MKRIKIWSMMMLVAMAMPMMVACGGDDSNGNDSNDGTAANYTEQEVMDILKGEWDVSGYLNVTYNDEEYQKNNYSGEYTAKLIFDPSNNNKKSYYYKIDKSLEAANYVSSILGTSGVYYQYSLIKKNSKYYFYRSNYHDEFEIQSLSKTSFRMVLDQDKYFLSDNNTKHTYHVRMTISSK